MFKFLRRLLCIHAFELREILCIHVWEYGRDREGSVFLECRRCGKVVEK